MTIKELRLMNGLTQTEFAKAIGIGLSSLTGYEAGKREPGAKALAAIKEVYGVDLNETLSAAQASSVAPAAPVEATPAEEKAVEKKATKKPRAKKQTAPAEEKPAQIIIQSPMGGEITPEDILAKAGDADKIYVRVDQNKLYIVNGDETSSVDLW